MQRTPSIKMKAIALVTWVATRFQIAHATNLTSLNSTATPPNLRTFALPASASGPTIDLGYAIYQGAFNATSGLNTFRGIRYAAAPTGPLRWQLPQPPAVDRTQVFQATQFGNYCPQASRASDDPADAASFATLGSEDCLFLNIYAPANARNLPVLVYIHNDGYGKGSGEADFSSLISVNDNGFIAVGIQCRLGAFGFLSSDEIDQFGVVNSGLRDQLFALQWVQSYIHMFGGNASQVTIGGSVLLPTLAFDGELGLSLFSNAIVASPYLVSQYRYNDWVPSQAYYAFAESAGCFAGSAFGNNMQHSTIFECLVNADSSVLMEANSVVSASGTYGTWAFKPVTDGTLLKRVPSQQLLQHRVNGARILSGNTANEGTTFVPQTLTREANVVSWLHETFPLFSDEDVAKLLMHYSASMNSVSNAMGVSATGHDPAAQQKRANDIYSESVFICPSYWLAEAFGSRNRKAFKYQYSVLPAFHGFDSNGYFGKSVDYIGADFMNYYQRIWGNFIMHNNPSVGNGEGTVDANVEAVIAWPAFSDANMVQVNLNQTGGQLLTDNHYYNAVNSTYYVDLGLEPDFSLVNAYTFANGQGSRCDFWRAIGSIVPE